MHSLEDWHKIMLLCKVDDILKFEENVEGMQITERNKFKCEICPQAKMSQSRNRLSDVHATKILEMVHVDLAGPIDPISKDCFKYVLGCIGDYPVEKRKISYFGLALNLFQHLISPNQDDLSYSARTFISG